VAAVPLHDTLKEAAGRPQCTAASGAYDLAHCTWRAQTLQAFPGERPTRARATASRQPTTPSWLSGAGDGRPGANVSTNLKITTPDFRLAEALAAPR
jgi:hypothetical protein